MRRKTGNRKFFKLKKLALSLLGISFFIAIILSYYNMLVAEKRANIIKDGEMSARQVETQFNEYLATSVDAIKLSAYTLEGMVDENRSGAEILDYLTGQSTAVINAIFENTMGVYGYINGGYYDGGGWVPDEGYEPKTRPWYTEAIENKGEVTLIDPYVDAQSGDVMMSLAKMLRDGESVVAMDVYLDRIQKITEEAVSSGATDIELILDARDMVVAHSDRGEVGKKYDLERDNLAAAILRNMNASDQDFFEFYYNDSHYIAYQAMLQNDWRCLSIKDATNVFQPLKRILLITVFVVVAVAIVLAGFLNRYIKNNLKIENLTEEAMLDKLTGFLNKAGTAAQMPELCRTETGMLAILDLDSFKLVNDIYGHDMGDRVLVSFAAIARQNTRAEDVLCRIGGDEFVVFCRGVTEGKVIAGLAKRLNSQLSAECKRLMGEDFVIPVGVSIGAVAVPEQGRDYRQLFPLADKALYQVKQNGKHGYAVYSDAMNAIGGEQDTLDGELSRITQILEERREADAALWLGQDAFTSVYRFMLRCMKHAGGAAVELLFLLSPAEGRDDSVLVDAADRFGAVLGDVLSVRDVILQSKPTQFFVLLPCQEDGGATVEAILAEWGKTSQHSLVTVTHTARTLHFSAAESPDAGA